MRSLIASLGLLALLALPETVLSVKHHDFKTCAQSGFCRRNRAYADSVIAGKKAAPYDLDPASIKMQDGVLTGTIWKTVEGQEDKVEFPLEMSFLENGVARVRIDERRRREGNIELRNGSKARKERYNEAGKWALVGEPVLDKAAKLEAQDLSASVTWSAWQNIAQIDYKPFSVRFLRHNEVHVVLNERNLMNIDHWRPKPEEGAEDGMWEETFGGNTDTKPRGKYECSCVNNSGSNVQ